MNDAHAGTLAVLLHADVAGSTAMVQQDERLAHARIQDAFVRFGNTIKRYHGNVRELRGDALLAEFERASDAVSAALSYLSDHARRGAQIDDGLWPAIRVGIALGEVIIADNTITGAGIVLAQRVEQLASPGGVCISGAIHEALPERLSFEQESLGEQHLKGFREPVRVYRIALSPGGDAPPPPASRRSGTLAWPRRRFLGVCVLSLAVLSSTVYWLQQYERASAPTFPGSSVNLDNAKPSIAVLPFDNLSEDQTHEYFADGLTDDLITDLSKVSGLFVIARNSVFTFKGQPVSRKTVSQDLGVRYIVEGSVRRYGNKIRVNAQLIEGNSGHHLWAERYDRELTNVFAVQDEIVQEIVSALAVQLTPNEEHQLIQRSVPALDAYELYLKGRDGYFSRNQLRMRESLNYFVQATTIDPKFAKAWSGLAQVAADLWRLRSVRELMHGAVARKIAEDAARKALQLDPNLPEGHSVLALLRLAQGEHEAALAYARRAVELDQNSADALTTLAIVLGYAGEPAAALDSIRLALRLNPRPPPYLRTYHGWALFLNGYYESALETLKPIANTEDRGITDSPREILAMAYASIGRMEEARSQVDALLNQEIFLNLEYYRAIYSAVHAREIDLQRRLDALRAAGMPEWPLDFRGQPKDQIVGAALQDLIMGKTWVGVDAARQRPFMQEISTDGMTVYASQGAFLNGTAFIQGDTLCERFEGFLLSQDICGPIFKNMSGKSERSDAYIYVNAATVRYFSLSQ